MTLHSSPMGRGGHRDDRRRRLLSEDLAANSARPAQGISATSSHNGQPPAHKSENYGDAEFLQTQLRLTDLIPRRLISYFLLLKVGLAAIAGLIALYIWSPDMMGDRQLRPAMANLGNCGSLGNWFASLLLLIASLLATIIYSVRRYKVDDYHGHYRVWLWAATCWFIAATDVAASLHEAVEQLMISLTGTRIAGDGSIWWVVPALLLVGTIGSRLLVDMWSSRLSSLALLLAVIAYLTALTAFFHGIVLQSEVSQLLLVHGAVLGGHLLLAMSMGLHARFVILDAEGLLAKRPRRKKAEKKKAEKKADKAATGDLTAELAAGDGEEEADDEKTGDEWIVVDPPHGSAQPLLKRVAPAETSAVSPLAQKIVVGRTESPSSSSADHDHDRDRDHGYMVPDMVPDTVSDTVPDAVPDNGKLSKADRKALKRKLIEQRMQREQRKASNW